MKRVQSAGRRGLATGALSVAVRMLFLAAFLEQGLTGADWLQFRGPLGSGVSEETSGSDPRAGSQKITWSVGLLGRGLSSPVIVGDRVFVTCSSGPRQDRLHVMCFGARDGVKRWERQFLATGRTMCHEKTSVAAPTPASDGERVYAFFSSNDVFCLDLEGNLVWLRGLGRDYPNASNSLGMSSSLAVLEGVLVAQVENDSESFAVGLDGMTGVNRWKLDRPKRANWTSPIIVPAGVGKFLVGLQSSAGLTAVEPGSGKEVWSYSEGASTIPSSAVSGRVIYVPSNGLTALEIGSAGGAPKQLWRSAQLRPSTPSPIVVGDKVFTLNDAGVLSCGETATGSRVWQLRLKGPFSASPVALGKLLYFVNEVGFLQVVDLSRPEGEVVSELDLKQTILSTPSISGGAVFVRSDGTLWKISNS